MPYEIVARAHHDELLEWLQENVGELLWSRPIVEWKGRGWTMNAYGMAKSSHQSIPIHHVSYKIRLDNAKLATLATLRWGNA